MTDHAKHKQRRASTIRPDDPEQFQRFVEAACEPGADSPEAAEVFERTLRRIVPPREPGKPAPKREPLPKAAGRRGKARPK